MPQALHATLLKFDHPATQRPCAHLAPLPPDLRRAVALLRAAAGRPEAPAVPGAAVDLAAVGL